MAEFAEAQVNTTIILPKVTHGLENKGIYSFTLENANVSIANALRRVIISDIETVVFDTKNDSINIIENTTRFHNEILKQRLGCIPIHIKDKEGIENILVEPAGAMSCAALNHYKDQIIGKNVGCIICGGNNDNSRMPEIKKRANNWKSKKI